MSPKVSLTAPQFSDSFGPVIEMCRLVGDSVLDGIFFFDHLTPLGDPSRPVLELAACLGAAAATTDRATIGSLVMRATLRDPAISLAITTTADLVAPGRLVVGLGAGDRMTREETERMGLAFESLDARLHTLDHTAASIQRRGQSVWIGGLHPSVRALAGRYGGWNAWDIDVDRFTDLAESIRRSGATITWGGPILLAHDEADLVRLVESRDRRPAIAGTAPDVASALRRYVDAGADHLVVSVIPNRPDRWELFATEVAPVLGATVGD